MILAVHWFYPEFLEFTFRQQYIMIYRVFPMSQNIPPTVNLLLSASSISFLSLKEVFQLRNYF